MGSCASKNKAPDVTADLPSPAPTTPLEGHLGASFCVHHGPLGCLPLPSQPQCVLPVAAGFCPAVTRGGSDPHGMEEETQAGRQEAPRNSP